jgi:NAD(P)-dependent dehydrogenase (short-subunit alcohol dehydrogenase family)
MTDTKNTPAQAAAKVAVVAAAGPGVGLAVAKRFAREGFAVALIARRRDALDAMVAEIVAEGGAARGFAADVTDPSALRAALAAAAADMGAPSVLVWNGGRWIETPALALDPSELEVDLRLTTVGALVAAQAVTPAMVAAGGGTILVTGGGLALAPQYGGAVPALTAGKAAARALVLAVAPELAAQGVHLATVTIAGQVSPGGPFDPDRIAEAFWSLHAEPRDAWTVERVFDGS